MALKADETSPNLYRFKVPVAAHSTAKLEVREHGPESTSVTLDSESKPDELPARLVKRVPEA